MILERKIKMANTTIKVKGTVGFYGKVNELRGEGKVYRLVIETPEFENATEENFKEMYSGDSWKDNTFYKDLIANGKVDVFMVHSKYPIDSVWVDNEKVSIDEYMEKFGEELSLNEAEIVMICRKGYIGPIKLIKNGKPYNPFE